MFSAFTVQHLLRGVHLDDASVHAEAPSSGRSFLDRPGQSGGGTVGGRSTGIFGRNTPPTIESLDSFDNHLYLGTSDGFLLHYTIEEQISSDSDLPRSRLIQRRNLGFGKKVVERILVLSALRVAVVHCDSTLSFFSLPEFSLISPQTHPTIKGVTAFCEDRCQDGRVERDGSVRLCVTKRRIIQFYDLWSDAISDPKDLTLPNGALVVTRWGNYVCVGDNSNFNLIDCRTGRGIPAIQVVQGSSSASSAQILKPACAAITDNEFLLASATGSGQTAIGIFCSGAGEAVRGTLQWSSYPRALAVEFPYVAALLRNNSIEIHNIIDQRLVQIIRFDPAMEIRHLVQGPGFSVWMSTLAKLLSFDIFQSQDPQSQGQEASEQERRTHYALTHVMARVLIAGRGGVSALVTTPLVLGADALLQNGDVDKALQKSEEATATLSSENRHRERIRCELDYIRQKSGLIYLRETLFDDAFGLLFQGSFDPRLVISMFPDVLQLPDLRKGVRLFHGVRELMDKLVTFPEIIRSAVTRTGGAESDEFEQVLMMNAKEAFVQYLVKCRRTVLARKDVTIPAAKAVDTALLGLWVDSGDDKDLIQLLESHNACIPDLCEQKLQESKKYYALLLWHRSHKNFKETLSIWKSLLGGEIEDSSFGYSLDDMAGFLTTISDIQLVEEYGWWIIERNESTGMKIFMPNDAKRAALFDSEQNLLLFKTKTSREGHLAYLEYLVLQRKSEVPEHHTSLCLLYTDKLSQLLGDATLSAKHEELVHSFKDQRREDLYDLSSQEVDLKKGTLDLQGRTFVGFLRQNSSADPISFSREKLLSLLQYSSYYDVEEVLIKVKALPSLQSERAVLSAKMSKHKDSIRLIVREVMDYYGAEIFCLNAGEYHPPKKSTRKQQTTEPCRTKGDTKQADEKRRKLFMYLLGEYLEIPFHEGGTALSLHLLNTQSYFLELSEVIHLLPPSWSVELLHQYLSRSLRRSQHEFKEIQVIKGLSLGENLRISEELHQLYQAQGPVVLTADDVCHVCGMAVADSVFMRTVDMQTIHLHCGSEPSKIS